MYESGHAACLHWAGRASNDELRAWLAADADSQSFQRLFQAVTPLLFAYFEGKLPGHSEELELLTLDTLLAIYLQRTSYDAEHQPFRAWLIGMARFTLTEHLRDGQPCRSDANTSRESPAACGVRVAGLESNTVAHLRLLARTHIDAFRTGKSAQATLAARQEQRATA